MSKSMGMSMSMDVAMSSSVPINVLSRGEKCGQRSTPATTRSPTPLAGTRSRTRSHALAHTRSLTRMQLAAARDPASSTRARFGHRRPQDGTVLCPAACKRRPAADQTVRHWRQLAKQGLWCHGWRRRLCGGDLACLCVRSTGVRSPGSYTPFGRRPRAPARAACATPAAAGPGWRCGGRACQLAGLRQGGRRRVAC